MFISNRTSKNIDDREYLGKEEYTILKTPNDPLIKYKGFKFSTQADLFIYKNQNFIQDNMKWIEIQTFKLYYDKKYHIQCLYIKNKNSINKTEIVLYSQCFYTNFSSSLPFLIDLSNYLKVNIITYEYNNKDKKDSNYYDVNILYNYLSKIEFIKSILLLGLSIGNKINMSVMLTKINSNSKNKIKAFIFISPTWVYDLKILTSHNASSTKDDINKFIDEVNKYNIPIFIIHGKQDLEVKYFLSVSYSFKIKNKCEWNPKNGTHYDIINEYRTKLLIKIKQFMLDNNLLNNVNDNFDSLSKINENVDNLKSEEIGERKTANFMFNIEGKNINVNNKKENIINNSNDDDYYFSHYNNKDIMEFNKNQLDINNYNNNINDYCEVYKTNIKNYDDVTLNQNMKNGDDNTLNQNMKDDDNITLNQNIENNDNDNINQKKKDYDNITINQNIIQYDEDQDLNNIPRISSVSFIPGDIIPNFKNNNENQNKNEIYRKPTNKNNRNHSFISFNV